MSDDGKMYKERIENGKVFLEEDRLIKIPKGYINVSLVREDPKENNRFMGIHRIIMQCFSPVSEEEYKVLQVNHIDGVKTNNKLENLEWCTSKENMAHAWKNGLYPHQKGETNPFHKLTDKDVDEIIDLLLAGEKGVSEIAQMYGVHKCTVSSIKHHRNWKHKTEGIILIKRSTTILYGVGPSGSKREAPIIGVKI